MMQRYNTLRDFLDQARTDAQLRQDFSSDPLGTLKQAGVGETSESIKNWFGVKGISDQELIEMLYCLVKPRNCSG